LPAALDKGTTTSHGGTAWICRGTTCLPPIRSLHELLHAVDRAS
jgi:uncharacterized protein YyaL (SSP411 family)